MWEESEREWEEFGGEWEGISKCPVCSSDQLVSPSPQQVYTFPLPNPKRLKEIPTDVSHEINIHVHVLVYTLHCMIRIFACIENMTCTCTCITM